MPDLGFAFVRNAAMLPGKSGAAVQGVCLKLAVFLESCSERD